MKNNFGFGRFEILTILVVLLLVFAFLAYNLLGGVSSKKIDTMKDSAISFSKTVTTNIASFHNTENIYLQEAIDEKLVAQIKSPFSRGNCSTSESLIQIIDGTPYATLKCDNILIEKANFTGTKDANIYEVSKWSDKKLEGENIEEKTLFNCKDGGKELFSEYYEELYFVYEINKKYNESYYFASEVSNQCEVVSKTFYRKKDALES